MKFSKPLFPLNGLMIPGIIFSWCILLSYACSSEKPQKGSGELPYELIEIPITYPYVSNYLSDIDVIKTDSGNVMVAYNHRMIALDFFDITHKKPSHSLPIAQEGPDMVPGVSTFSIDDASIVLQSRSDFIRMNMNAGVLSKMSVSKMVDSVYRYDQIENYTIFHYGATIGNYESSGYSTESKQFLHYVYPEKGNFDLTYSGVIGASFNLEDSSTTFIPIRYPEILKQKNYGSLSCANFIQHGDLIVYNFPFRSNVYTYNRKTGKQKEYNPQSAYTENEARPMDQKKVSPQDQGIYDFCALRFGKLYYIKKHNVYIRVHYDTREEFMKDRHSFIMIVNDQFKPIAEYPLPDNFAYPDCTESDVYFTVVDKNDDDSYLRLARIDLEALL